MGKLSTKSCIIYDNGTFVSLAERLAKDFGKVMYYSPCKTGFPQKKLALIGEGLKGVERIIDFWDYIDDADILIFPDVIDGDMQVHLDSIGKKVFGSRKGEDMELDRVGMKETMKDLKLPVGKYEVIKGMDNLRKYLKEHKDVWVKISRWRGDFETLQSNNYDYICLKLDEIEHELGAWANQMEFVCEADLPDKVEVGYDGYCINGQFPNKTMFGIEIKDLGYVGVMKDYKDLPEPVINFNTKIAPIMKSYKYKNFYSSEIRVGADKKGYMIDSCNRCGSPPNELYQEMFTNISDIIWEGAHDKCIDPIPKAKYGAEVLIHCPWAEKNWLPIQYPEKYYDSIKFRDVMDLKGQHYIIPQYVGLPEIGAIVATGDTIEEAFKTIEKIAETVRGYYVDVPLHALDSAMEEIEKLKKFGYDVFK